MVIEQELWATETSSSTFCQLSLKKVDKKKRKKTQIWKLNYFFMKQIFL